MSGSAVPPVLVISSATNAACSARRPRMPTRAPAAASPRARAPPSTPVPPVTIAILPASENDARVIGYPLAVFAAVLYFLLFVIRAFGPQAERTNDEQAE